MNEELRALGDEFWEYQLEVQPTGTISADALRMTKTGVVIDLP